MVYKRQEMFDIVADHLLTQMEKSKDLDACLYRHYVGDKTLKCAVGALIPDDRYDSIFDCGLITNPGDKSTLHVIIRDYLSDLFSQDDYKFLIDLQIIHDQSGPNNWKEELKEFAVKYALNSRVLNK